MNKEGVYYNNQLQNLPTANLYLRIYAKLLRLNEGLREATLEKNFSKRAELTDHMVTLISYLMEDTVHIENEEPAEQMRSYYKTLLYLITQVNLTNDIGICERLKGLISMHQSAWRSLAQQTAEQTKIMPNEITPGPLEGEGFALKA